MQDPVLPKPSKSLPILQSLPEGSSGTGISHYSSAVTCSRRLQLDLAAKAAAAASVANDDAADSDSEPGATDVGKIFHALCEIYHNTGTRHIAIELPQVHLGTAADEAWRLFEGYADRFGPSDYAEVLGTEMLIPAEGDVAQAQKVAAAVGVSPFTMRLDMVVRVDERSAGILYDKRGLILTPGVYLWDYKTKKARGSNDEMLYRHSPQFIAYQHVWNSLYPEMPCMGMVADIVVRHKKLEDKSFYSVLVPPPTPQQVRGLQRWLKFAQTMASHDEPNWLACFDWGRACQHLTSGACTRA